MNITHRKAVINDLETIVQLLSQDYLGKTREQQAATIDDRYVAAFAKIDADPINI